MLTAGVPGIAVILSATGGDPVATFVFAALMGGNLALGMN